MKSKLIVAVDNQLPSRKDYLQMLSYFVRTRSTNEFVDEQEDFKVASIYFSELRAKLTKNHLLLCILTVNNQQMKTNNHIYWRKTKVTSDFVD
jgi:hypothetical protein